LIYRRSFQNTVALAILSSLRNPFEKPQNFMKNTPPDTFSLDFFEGPLMFLLHLIQNSEINICDVSIQEITTQYLNKIKEFMVPPVDTGAEFIGTTALLLLMKSKMLLPKHERPLMDDDELESSFDLIHTLLEYCSFKEAAKLLTQKEYQQSVFHPRGISSLPEKEKRTGVEHLTIDDLAKIFENVFQAAPPKRKIHEEPWRVSDKINILRNLLKAETPVGFEKIFSRNSPRIELIVTFLALLELMKMGEIVVARESNSDTILIFRREEK
jgi:segregation and condensation protein A